MDVTPTQETHMTDEQKKAKQRDYRERNIERINAVEKVYRERNKQRIAEKAKEYGKKYREDNKERIAEYNKKYREENPEYSKNYADANRERAKQYREEHKEETKRRNQSPVGKYGKYKYGAKRRGYDFDLTFEEFESFWGKSCYYCSVEISTIGLDRVRNDAGYHVDNLVPCCIFCNRMKMAHTKEEFFDKISKIYHIHIQDNHDE